MRSLLGDLQPYVDFNVNSYLRIKIVRLGEFINVIHLEHVLNQLKPINHLVNSGKSSNLKKGNTYLQGER